MSLARILSFAALVACLPSHAIAAEGRESTCTTGASAEAELRAMHDQATRAHLEGNADLLAEGWAEEVVSASNGNVSVNRRDAMRTRFGTYLAGVRYLEWRAVEPPVVRVSPDGRMGWMAVKIVARLTVNAEPERGEQSFRSSWVATYERQNCRWKMTSIASSVVE